MRAVIDKLITKSSSGHNFVPLGEMAARTFQNSRGAFLLRGDQMRIKLTQGKFAIIDDQDKHFNKLNWYAFKNKKKFYAVRVIRVDNKRKTVFLHHYVKGFPLNKMQIDHINGNSLDNRSNNLRIVTNRGNQHNSKRRRDGKTSSKYIGVYWFKQTNRWRAQIVVNRKNVPLGYFKDEEKASQIYQKVLKQITGEK